MKSWLISAVAILASGSLWAQTDTASGRNEDELRQEYYQIIARAANNPILGDFIRELRLRAARVGLDARVNEALRRDEMTYQLAPDVEAQVREFIEIETRMHQRTGMLAFTAEEGGGVGQQEHLLEMWREELANLGFSEDAIRDAKLFYVGRDVVNAYTFSGNPRFPVAAFYEGLVNLYLQHGEKGEQALRAVMRHEAGHILKRDIYWHIMIFSVFFATGRDLIPDRAGDRLPMPVADFVQLQGIKHQFFNSLTHRARDRGTHYTEEELMHLEAWFNRTVDRVRARFGNNQRQLEGFAKRIAAALGQNQESSITEAQIEEGFASLRAARSRLSADADENANDEGGIDIKAFIKLLIKVTGVWSNSKEFGADRVVLTAEGISPRQAAYADALLMAGNLRDKDGQLADLDATLDSLLAQGRMNSREAAHDDLLRDIVMATGAMGSHPNLLDRMSNYSDAANTAAFKPWRDWFRGAVMLWLEVSKKITQLDLSIEEADRPATVLAMNGVKILDLKKFAKELAELLIDAVVSDLRKFEDETQLVRFDVLKRSIEEAIKEAESVERSRDDQSTVDKVFAKAWRQTMGSSNLILAKLISTIEGPSDVPAEALPDPIRAEILKQLNDVMPDPVGSSDWHDLVQLAKKCAGDGKK